jgi:hypothetical protein
MFFFEDIFQLKIFHQNEKEARGKSFWPEARTPKYDGSFCRAL